MSQVKLAADLLEVGEIEDGLKIFKKMASQETLDNSVKAKALYNLGTAQLRDHKYKDSLSNIKKALRLHPTSSRYKKAISLANEFQQRKQQVDEQ